LKLWVVVTAAGSGRRMGGGNKLLLPFRGRPLLVTSIEYFQQASQVHSIVVSAPLPELDCYRDLMRSYQLDKVHQVVAGGAERQDSIRLALESLAAKEGDIVAIHDGARPVLAAGLLGALLDGLGASDAVLPMVAVKDTVKRVDSQGRVLETLERSELFAAQTPQLFRFGTILKAHKTALREGFVGTDDCSLIERYGGVVKMVPGDYRNVKLTTSEDLLLLEHLQGV